MTVALVIAASVLAILGALCAYYAGARFLDAMDEHDDESTQMFGGVSSSSSGRGDAPAVPAQPHTAGRSPHISTERSSALVGDASKGGEAKAALHRGSRCAPPRSVGSPLARIQREIRRAQRDEIRQFLKGGHIK